LLTHYAFSLAAVDFFAAGFFAAGFLAAALLGAASALASAAASVLAGLAAFFSASRFSSTTMVIWLKNFSTPPELPRARAWKRVITRFLPTEAWLTTRSSTSRS